MAHLLLIDDDVAVIPEQVRQAFSGPRHRVVVAGNERMATINNISDPTDIMMAQYSIPFCVALALFRDPRDPASFDASALSNPDIRAMCRRVTVVAADPPTRVAGASIVTVTLKDGTRATREVEEFDGTPARPLSSAALREKFMMFMGASRADPAAAFERLQGLESEADVQWLG